MRSTFLTLLALTTLSLFAACSSSASTAGTAAPTDTTSTADAGADAASQADTAAAPDVPAGPQPAALKPYAGTCPTFTAGANAFETGGYTRNVRISLPADPAGAAVLFVWHGLGDNAGNMSNAFGADALANKYNAIVVVPDGCCNGSGSQGCCSQMTGWGFAAKPEPDVAIFDDALSCLDQQFGIDRTRIYTTGFSAGSLWSTWLVMNRSDYLAAAAIFSGGVNSFLEYTTPTYKLPVLATSGKEDDVFGGGLVDFFTSMNDLTTALRKDGHFVIRCIHTAGGHTVPFGGPGWAAKFLFKHTWKDGSSPYQQDGLGTDFPAYCTIAP